LKIVIALGGNAILQPGEKGTAAEQFRNVKLTCCHIADVVKNGHQVLITHGNGPQVGNILIQNKLSAGVTPAMPLSICGAQSQGMIGYMIQQAIMNEYNTLSVKKHVVSIITQTLVDERDVAFRNPTKPIGPFYSESEAQTLRSKGIAVKEDSGRGWRMVVPSPSPVEVLEKESIKTLIEKGFTVIAVGGGGIPVVRDRIGNLQGTRAVIDKDLGSQRIANDIGADTLAILTGVEKVSLNFNKSNQVDLNCVSVQEISRYYREGHFGEGSMAPKIEAAIRFIEEGGEQVIITSLEKLSLALAGHAGTIITK